jgi:c-di-GMP-binding flagellar brake protein YcgR
MTEPPAGPTSQDSTAEIPLVPGELLILERRVGGKRLKGAAAYVGRQGDRYLLADLPLVNGSPIFSTAGADCVVRFLDQGVMFGFESVVEHISYHPVPLIFLAFPTHLEQLNLRKEKRVKVGLTCELNYDADQETKSVPGRIVDASISGCRVIVDQAFDLNDRVDLGVEIENGSKIAIPESIVRNLSALGGGQYALGIQFKKESPDWREYVTRISALTGE